LNRSSGILLHPTSLPGSFGIGDFGAEAREFVDFLAAAGQRLWQCLPLGPTGFGNSPYQSLSAFAGNTLLIDPRQLIVDGLLTPQDLAHAEFPEDHVEFERVRQFKDELLRKTYENFKRELSSKRRAEFEAFCELSAWWLDDYALFRALKAAQGGRAWTDWDRDLAERQPAALARARVELQDHITAQKVFQFLFFRQWKALRDYCHKRGVRVIGDLPIFVAHDSVDVWINPRWFKLGQNGRPIVVAGVPPDYYSATGQVWNSPLYDWDQMRADGFTFWISRVRAALQIADLVRIDHFRGFVACWEIPAGSTNAAGGRWVDAPGWELFAAVRGALGDLPMVAEDLGDITAEVNTLRDALGFPGMRVMQFGFTGDLNNIHLPQNYPSNIVTYTGTHDSDTTIGWFNQLSDQQREFCLQYLHSDGHEIHWDCIAAALASAADTAIAPLQDLLGLGSEARMNVPNSPDGNWIWRYTREHLTDGICGRLSEMTKLYGRS
jgi:4-alpha-glucanotransferase